MNALAPQRTLLALIILLVCKSQVMGASLYPLGLSDARLLPKNSGEIRLGVSYAENRHNLFQKEDLDRRIAELPSIDLKFALGERIECDLHYSLLYLEETGQATKAGSGDLVVGFKIGLLREEGHRPAIAARFAAKLPNADEHDDFGTDQTDIYIQLLGTQPFEQHSVYFNAGLGILGDPRIGTNSQDDIFLYGIGISTPLRKDLELMFSLEGQDFGEEVNRRGVFLAGMKGSVGMLFWDLGVGLGYTTRSESWSIRGGITLPFSFPNY